MGDSTNTWTTAALFLLDQAEVDATGMEYCWSAIRDEMRRIEVERFGPCQTPKCIKHAGHDRLCTYADATD